MGEGGAEAAPVEREEDLLVRARARVRVRVRVRGRGRGRVRVRVRVRVAGGEHELGRHDGDLGRVTVREP